MCYVIVVNFDFLQAVVFIDLQHHSINSNTHVLYNRWLSMNKKHYKINHCMCSLVNTGRRIFRQPAGKKIYYLANLVQWNLR